MIRQRTINPELLALHRLPRITTPSAVARHRIAEAETSKYVCYLHATKGWKWERKQS